MKNTPPDFNISQHDIEKELNTLDAQFPFNEKSLGDKTLIALRDGDHQAYHDIYYTYKEPIEHFLFKLLRSEDYASELTQAIFVNLWEKRETVDPNKSIKSYLFTVARNTVFDCFKHMRVHDRYINHEMYNEELDYDSDEAMIAEETRYLIEIAVSRMPPKRRKVFELSRYENLSNEEIAKKLKMNKLTVASHIAQALKDIREILALFYILFVIS